MPASDPFATTVVAAHLAGLGSHGAALPRDRWEAAGLPALGVDLPALAALLDGAPGPLADLIALADGILGAQGEPLPRRGSPFDLVRLLAPDSPSPATPAAPVADGLENAQPIPPARSLDDLSTALLRALGRAAVAA